MFFILNFMKSFTSNSCKFYLLSCLVTFRSMQDSPDIPFGTEKKPAQGILKTKSANSTPNGLPTSKAALRYNTQMNSKSKAAKKLGLNSRERLMFRF